MGRRPESSISSGSASATRGPLPDLHNIQSCTSESGLIPDDAGSQFGESVYRQNTKFLLFAVDFITRQSLTRGTLRDFLPNSAQFSPAIHKAAERRIHSRPGWISRRR
jgi:hypothetical protein